MAVPVGGFEDRFQGGYLLHHFWILPRSQTRTDTLVLQLRDILLARAEEETCREIAMVRTREAITIRATTEVSHAGFRPSDGKDRGRRYRTERSES